MRSVRIATWTSGDPVSPLVRALSLMTSVLRSAVIDIYLFLEHHGLKIEAAHDLQRSRQSLDQGDRTIVVVPSPIEPVVRSYPGPDTTLTDRPCRFRGKVQSRDVDQPCLKQIGRAVQQECRDRSRMPSSA
eukprot:TRINITY_DN2514_c0_g1_i7.p1 TRINITY_DN2514_c0_g1~~TRINITY_DN2514_c0_g1_i7.p1  ORF type:complete len:131 (-),score=11.05 TRINITY_DN2514_c0_g1_i7:37-429(-)